MKFSLPSLARRQRNIRRRAIALRDIAPPATLATSLFQTYAKVMAAWSNAAPRIMAAYELTVADMTTDSPADVSGEIETAADAINRLLLLLTPELREWALGIERWQRGKWVSSVLVGTGVDLTTLISVGDVTVPLETAINWNVALIKDVSAQAQQRISNAVWDGLRNGKASREVANDLRAAVDLGRRRSERIAADQLVKLHSSLADERRRQAGLPVWEWLHSRKAHPRANHIARNGNYYSDDPAMIGKVINGKTVEKPPEDRPGQLPYCACRSRSVLVFGD